MNNCNNRLTHEIPPVVQKDCRVLILGSFPSVLSRQTGFYYGNPQNRFWRVLALLLEQPLPYTNEEKKAFLLTNHIALWDVIQSCEIKGSSDSSIKNAVVNPIQDLIKNSDCKAVFLNGKAAARLYQQFVEPKTPIPSFVLPSTSAANASWQMDRLLLSWRTILDYLK